MIELMKFDMGGSACTLGAAKVIRGRTKTSLPTIERIADVFFFSLPEEPAHSFSLSDGDLFHDFVILLAVETGCDARCVCVPCARKGSHPCISQRAFIGCCVSDTFLGSHRHHLVFETK